MQALRKELSRRLCSMHPGEEGSDESMNTMIESDVNATTSDGGTAIEQLQREAEVLRKAEKDMEAAALEFRIHIIEKARKAISS